MTICPFCQGIGREHDGALCETCKGKGHLSFGWWFWHCLGWAVLLTLVILLGWGCVVLIFSIHDFPER